jgi:hypothetical protein
MVRFIRSVWELTELRVVWRLKNMSCVVKIRRLFTCVQRQRSAERRLCSKWQVVDEEL